MQALNSTDLNSVEQRISSRLNALKTGTETVNSEKKLSKSLGNSLSEPQKKIASQLDKIKDLQKRYQREPPNSLDQLIGFIFQTKGQGSDTLRYLRKKLLEVSVTLEPKAAAILKEESIKALGCSQEQTYKGISPQTLSIQPLSTIPQGPNDGFLYIPVQSVDFFGNLKNSPESQVGKVYFEKPEPSADPIFKPFGGRESFPMNKQLYQIMEPSNNGRSLSQILGKNYQGRSGQNLFDVQYTTTNGLGITGNFYRVALINRENNSGVTVNKVGEFISDYYSTIQINDPVDIGAQLVNLISGAINIKGEIGWGEIDNKSKFDLIIQRILGLCFDNRREIDVSGIAKIAELDGVDETFFDFNEVDLRNIDIQISNIQNGIMEFEDCDNIKVPVDTESLIDQLIDFRNQTASTVDDKVETIEQIIDSISQNPEWKVDIPNNVNVGVAINQQVLKKLPLAAVAGILTPKVLLPIFTVMAITQSAATFTYNQAVTSANTYINSANTAITSGNTMATEIGREGSNIVTSGVDFLKKWKSFSINLISRINEEFLKTLYEILKRDIVNLIGIIIKDVERSKVLKKYSILFRLLEVTAILAQLINDYRRCKSLMNNILLLLNSINGFSKEFRTFPVGLLAAARALPGFSSERATINFIEKLQKLGIPTGTLPDGSPNLMNLYNLLTNKAIDEERAANEKVEIVLDSPVTGVGKSF
jgi:hypothetical protein